MCAHIHLHQDLISPVYCAQRSSDRQFLGTFVDAHEMPSRKRSRGCETTAQGGVDKENTAANRAPSRQNRGKRASRPAVAKRAIRDEADM